MTNGGLAGPLIARRRRRTLIAAVTVLVVLLGGGGVLVWRTLGDGKGEVQQDAVRFAQAWSSGELAQLEYGGNVAGKEVAAAYERIVADLSAESVRARVEQVSVSDGSARARLAVAWKLNPQTTWRYDTTVPLVRADGEAGGEWAVRWRPSIVHPKLAKGSTLVAQRQRPDRAPILGRDGQPIVTRRPVLHVGVIPGKVPDPVALADSLREVLDIDAEGLAQQIRDAGDNIFVQVITLREPDFRPIEQELRALPGVAWREDTLPLAPTRGFAGALLGRSGPVTAEVIEESGGRYEAGDVAGLSGLQRRYDQRLAGTAGVRVQAVPADDNAEQPEPVRLFEQKATPGRPVRTTLDPQVQRAAETALGPVKEKSALVAMHVPTGKVLAVANGPHASGYNRALRGHYPPGSTFKVASTLALLRAGVSPDETVRCPKFAHVGGRAFHNYNHFELGAVPFRIDFAKSCNTAFIGLASRLGDRALTQAAATLGIGRSYGLGVPAFSGNVPPTRSPIDQAAAMIGQGRVLASPLAMANAAATIARGSYKAPSLVVKPEPKRSEPPSDARDLSEARAQTLERLMRKVVTMGSGGAVADVPGSPVSAKTGTAEYGTANPPKTHAWFIGFQDDIAFAVFVQNGDSGGKVAAPIAADFLEALHPEGS